MTTQINDIHDLLRLLEERPDLAAELRQRTLTPELLAMPEQMAQLTVRVDGLAEQMAALTLQVAELGRRLDEFIQEQRGINREQQEFNQEQREFVQEQREINREQREFNREQREFNREQQEFNQEQREFVQEQREINREQREFNREQREFNRRMEGSVNTLTGQVGNLRGERYERRLKRRLPNLLRSRCQLDHCELLQNPEEGLPPQMMNALREQQRDGKVTAEELDNLLEADYIARARGLEDDGERYVVVEAALTVDDRDIERARGRAATLERTTGVATLALVVGETINPPQWSRAQGQGVTLLQVDA